jgi:flagellar motor switch/type III secretory pathway protein FliN
MLVATGLFEFLGDSHPWFVWVLFLTLPIIGLIAVSALVKWADRRYCAARRKTEGPQWKSGCLYGCLHLFVWIGLVILAAWGSLELAGYVDRQVKQQHLSKVAPAVAELIAQADEEINGLEEQRKALVARLGVLERRMAKAEAEGMETALERARDIHTRLKVRLAETEVILKEIRDLRETLKIEAEFGREVPVDRVEGLRKALLRADEVLREVHNLEGEAGEP